MQNILTIYAEVELLLKKLKAQSNKSTANQSNKTLINKLFSYYYDMNDLAENPKLNPQAKKYAILIEQYLTEANILKRITKSASYEEIFNILTNLNLQTQYIMKRYRFIELEKRELVKYVKQLIIILTRLLQKTDLLDKANKSALNLKVFAKILQEAHNFKNCTQYTKIKNFMEKDLKNNKGIFHSLEHCQPAKVIKTVKDKKHYGKAPKGQEKDLLYFQCLLELKTHVNLENIHKTYVEFLKYFRNGGNLVPIVKFSLEKSLETMRIKNAQKETLYKNRVNRKSKETLIQQKKGVKTIKHPDLQENSVLLQFGKSLLTVPTRKEEKDGILSFAEYSEKLEMEKNMEAVFEKTLRAVNWDKKADNERKKMMFDLKDDLEKVGLAFNCEFYKLFDDETLFFSFYDAEHKYKQYLIAKELQARKWLYNIKEEKWFKACEVTEKTKLYWKGSFQYFEPRKSFSLEIANSLIIYLKDIFKFV